MPRVRIAAVLLLALGCARGHKAGPNDLAPPVASAATALSCRTLQSCTDACMDPACAEACVRRLTAAARPAYEALQACVVPACAEVDAGAAPCRVPGSFACKLCVLSRCAAQASACMAR